MQSTSPMARPALPLGWLLAAACAVAVGLTGPGALRQQAPDWAAALPEALAVNVAFALVAFVLRAVTPSGAVAGCAVGTTLLATLGWQGWLLLGCAFLIAMTTTAAGWRQKARRGLEEPHRGRRAAGNVLANTGGAAVLAVVASTWPDDPRWVVGFAAALATGASDTAASEIGKAVRGRTWLLPSMRPVAPGSLGAASIAGTAAGAASACVFGLAALGSGLVSSGVDAGVVSLAATIALLAEGPLAVATEGRDLLDNDGVNLTSSMVGAALAVAATSVAR